jgi:hypothetical protein
VTAYHWNYIRPAPTVRERIDVHTISQERQKRDEGVLLNEPVGLGV